MTNTKPGAESDNGKPNDEAGRQANKAENDVLDQTKQDPGGNNAARKGEGSEQDPNPTQAQARR